MQEVTVSIIIPSYNAGPGLLRTLESLFSMDYTDPYEVIVVNSSQDDLEKKVEDQYPKTVFLQLSTRAYTAESKNRGIERATGDLLAFIDADCVAAPDWLSRIVALYRKGHRIAGGAICSLNPEKVIPRAEYLLESIQLSPNSPSRFVQLISTANCFMVRDIFHKYGGYPDIKKGADLVYSKKLALAGEPLLFEPSIRIYHYYSEKMKRFLSKQVYHGRYSCEARRIVPLPGGFLVNQPLLLPLFPIIRLVAIAKHIVKLKTGNLADYFLTFPILFIGVLAWSYGFLLSSVSRTEHEP